MLALARASKAARSKKLTSGAAAGFNSPPLLLVRLLLLLPFNDALSDRVNGFGIALPVRSERCDEALG
jgi:hypothetical protein